MSTLKQQEANRRNALKSTGPCSVEGKKRSRRNALTHGLAGEGMVLPHEEAAAVEERMAEWHSSFKPFDPYDTWLLGVIAVESVRVDRCRVQDRILRHEQMHRMCETRSDEERQSAEELAAKLAKNPSVVAKLRATISGTSLLLDHWNALARVLESEGWSAAHEALALDLLGTPQALREGAGSPLDPGPDGDLLAHQRQLIREQIQRLNRLKNVILPARAVQQHELAQVGVPDLKDPVLLRLHRYESRCFHRLRWASQQMKSQRRVTSSMPEREREPMFPIPPRTTLPEPKYEATPQVPQPIEPPVYRRPMLREALSPAEYGQWAAISAKLSEKGLEPESKNSPKNLPSPKDRPSRRLRKTPV